MTKKLLMLAAVLSCAMTMWAQGPLKKTKMSHWLLNQYQQQQRAVKQNGGPLKVKGRTVRNYILTLVQSTDEAATVREKGGVVWQNFGDGICAAFLPTDSLGVLNESPCILCMEANAPSRLLNDTSAIITGVTKAWDFENALTSNLKPHTSSIPQAFTGKGVVAGVIDIGFDFTHPAFRNDDGTSRIKWFWDPQAPCANDDLLGMIYSSPELVLAARHCTNADQENHGTHVLGSMAGDGLNGHYVGMAPEADIMAAYIPLYTMTDAYSESLRDYIQRHLPTDLPMDNAILQVAMTDVTELVEFYKIFEQADAAGQPCVVNCSFGAPFDFFHDTELYEQVVNQLLGPGHIIVAAAGNSGRNMTYLKKEADQPLDIEMYYGGCIATYEHNIRTNPGVDFRVGYLFPNLSDTLFIDTRDFEEVTSTNLHNYGLSTPEVDLFVDIHPAVYGTVGYQIQTIFKDDYMMNLVNPKDSILRAYGRIFIDTPVELEVVGKTSDECLINFGNENLLTSRGCHLGTILNPSGINRIISVGAMHHRSKFTNYWNEVTTTDQLGSQEGHLAAFSSCGPTVGGLVKPDVVAPGFNIISAYNGFYKVNHDEQQTFDKVGPLIVYQHKVFGEYFAMFALSGTSMASPIAAGIIALWLQAKPDLTPEDILGVIARTSHQPEPEFSGYEKNNYYGYGEIDAYAGLLDILQLTDIPELSHHQPAGLTFRVEGSTLYIDGLNGEAPITVYDLTGRPALQTVTTGTLQLPDLAAGVYAVQVGQMGSTLIRL